LTVESSLFRAASERRFFGRGSVDQINGNHAGSALLPGGKSDGELNKALGLDEVNMKMRPQRVAHGGDPMGFTSAFTQAGVVKSDHGGSGGGESCGDGPAYGLKKSLGIHPIMAVESIIGCPVLELTTGRTQKSGYGMATKTDKLAEQMTSDALGRRRTGCLGRLVQEVIDSVEEGRGVFFTATGEGGT
jgi:hypothetical protein